MTAIWHDTGEEWALLAPAAFEDEKTLHRLVAANPALLPLSGAPRLVVVGSEVRLGAGYADLIAVEPEGQVAVIEVKLANNAEARRAVVAQVLAYSAFLHGLSYENFEREVLGAHLSRYDYESLVDAMEKNDQEGSFDPDGFRGGVSESLQQGRFRLVFVLDTVPDELVTLGGFLDIVADKLTIDLVTVSQYRVEGSRFLVPQRVEPGRTSQGASGAAAAQSRKKGQMFEGSDEFRASIDEAPDAQRPALIQLADWVESLGRDGLIRIQTYRGVLNRWTLLPYLRDIDAGLVTVWHDSSGAAIQFWRSVFENKAPQTLVRIESKLHPTRVGQGNTVREFDEELLELLSEAYVEGAAGSKRANL